ncbi:hypothetical protein RRG08_051963 [Elysia crispata]|uniref:Uncharacterized protein n=1 Tax=Elysia crispata TaxID=231223 RepID=A0AAE0ZCL6_9GAST|nr:hypothetical protein RRG08_051963 [Elysia crispata]
MQFAQILVCIAVVLKTTHTQGSKNIEHNVKQVYSLEVNLIKETFSRLRVIWFLTQGNVSNINSFQFTLTSHLGRTLIDCKLGKKQRSIGLHPMSPDSRYSITVKALDSKENILAEKVVPVTAAPTDTVIDRDSSGEGIFLRANEIRARHARLAWALNNVDPARVKKIRLYIEREGFLGPQTVQLELSPDKRTFYFTRIPLHSVLCVTVIVIGKDDQPFLNSNLQFWTPDEGVCGQPITGSPIPFATLMEDCCKECRWHAVQIDPA